MLSKVKFRKVHHSRQQCQQHLLSLRQGHNYANVNANANTLVLSTASSTSDYRTGSRSYSYDATSSREDGADINVNVNMNNNEMRPFPSSYVSTSMNFARTFTLENQYHIHRLNHRFLLNNLIHHHHHHHHHHQDKNDKQVQFIRYYCYTSNNILNYRTSTRSSFLSFSSSTKDPKSDTPTTTTTTTTITNGGTTENPTTVNTTITNTSSKVQEIITSILSSTKALIIKTPSVIFYYITHPIEFKDKLIELKDAAKKELHHYYMGSKLLMADIRTARQILLRTLQGSSLTRRERKQLLRTVSDVFRLVPMSVFVIVPFMEFALPFALKIWPNMLPSTFQDSLKEEENMKNELKTRIAMAEFFQETLQDLAKEQKKAAANRKKALKQENDNDSSATTQPSSDLLKLTETREESASSFLEFIEKARQGEMIPPEVVIKYSTYFKDELTLDNMPRMQLINMCRYMNIPPYGNETVLRFQLRHKIRSLQEDDQRIIWEGIESLTKMELREACRERGMRSTGLSKESYKRSLQQWLDLSVNRNVPIALLIMSRTFFLQEEMAPSSRGGAGSDDVDKTKHVASLADAISGMEKEVINEVILEAASSNEQSGRNTDVIKLKLEILQQQNELIEEENRQREADNESKVALKKLDKEKAEKEQQLQQQQQQEQAEKEKAAEKLMSINNITEESVQKQDTTTRVEINATASSSDSLSSTSTTLMSDEKKLEEEKKKEDSETSKGEDEEPLLSSSELDAIKQLISPNSVFVEREALERLKASLLEDKLKQAIEDEKDKIKDTNNDKAVTTSSASTATSQSPTLDTQVSQSQDSKEAVMDSSKAKTTVEKFDTILMNEEDLKASTIISEADKKVEKESKETTIISMDGSITDKSAISGESKDIILEGSEMVVKEEEQTQIQKAEEKEEEEEEEFKDEKLEKAIARLQSKLDSMVGKIEIQLSDVEAKIGDKFHFLDKDQDGILSKEELAICLQSVLKRPLSYEEAMAIASDMDENEDGFFSIEEMNNWLETSKIMQLVKEGRDDEVDKMIASQSEKLKQKKEDNSKVTVGSNNMDK